VERVALKIPPNQPLNRRGYPNPVCICYILQMRKQNWTVKCLLLIVSGLSVNGCGGHSISGYHEFPPSFPSAGTGPVLLTITPKSIVHGSAALITLTGLNLNVPSETVYFTASGGTFISVPPQDIGQTSIDLPEPPSLTAGTYSVSVVQNGIQTYPVTLTVS
jgi:hypothetical protein